MCLEENSLFCDDYVLSVIMLNDDIYLVAPIQGSIIWISY